MFLKNPEEEQLEAGGRGPLLKNLVQN